MYKKKLNNFFLFIFVSLIESNKIRNFPSLIYKNQMKSATSLLAQSQKNQPAQNSAVKYKNTTMNTIQNLKLASSNLKNEIEKMLSSKKNENSIKVAKIQLNRTNDTSEVVVENSMERKNKNGLKK